MPTAPVGFPDALGLHPSGLELLAPSLEAWSALLQPHHITCSKDDTHCCEATLGRSLTVYSHFLATFDSLHDQRQQALQLELLTVKL